MFSQIKDRKHIEQNFHSGALAMPQGWDWGCSQGGGWGTLIFSRIRRLWLFFGVQNYEFQYFLGFSEKGIFF